MDMVQGSPQASKVGVFLRIKRGSPSEYKQHFCILRVRSRAGSRQSFWQIMRGLQYHTPQIGRCGPWLGRSLENASLGRYVPWTICPLDMRSVTDMSWTRTTASGYSHPNQTPTIRAICPNVLAPIGQGHFILGTHHPKDASSKGRIVQGMHHTRLFVRGHTGQGRHEITLHRWDEGAVVVSA